MLMSALVCVSACQRERAGKSDDGYPAPSSSSGMDGMQLASARRVALESATAAMQRRDLQRLTQLDVWVRNRAQVAILEPDDLAALSLAIQCLEQVAPARDALQSLDRLTSGTLKQPARALCAGRATP
jgi:hypothetical protein